MVLTFILFELIVFSDLGIVSLSRVNGAIC